MTAVERISLGVAALVIRVAALTPLIEARRGSRPPAEQMVARMGSLTRALRRSR